MTAMLLESIGDRTLFECGEGCKVRRRDAGATMCVCRWAMRDDGKGR